MTKFLVILSALIVLAAAAPQLRQQQSAATPLQERRTAMEWEQIANMIEEVFGISTNGEEREEQEQEQEQELNESTEQPESEAEDDREERMREFMERQQERTGAAALEDREERNREAMERAEGRLPEREARRRQQNQRKNHLMHKLAEMKRKQWEQDQERSGEKKKKMDRNYNSFPLYEFSYGVHDPTTGDKKEQWEKRVGDHVKGKYTLDQPDGTKRVVEYEADDKKGFEAVVKEIDRIDERHRGDVRWGHSDAQVAQSYSKLKKVD